MAEKIGRKAHHFHPDWSKDPIAGLIKQKDGRWRILATGERFTEADERRAVKRFLEWKAKNAPPGTVDITAPMQPHLGQPIEPTMSMAGKMLHRHQAAVISRVADTMNLPEVQPEIGYPMPEEIFWPWLSELLTDHPELVASKTGIAEVASLRHMAIPTEGGRNIRMTAARWPRLTSGSATSSTCWWTSGTR